MTDIILCQIKMCLFPCRAFGPHQKVLDILVLSKMSVGIFGPCQMVLDRTKYEQISRTFVCRPSVLWMYWIGPNVYWPSFQYVFYIIFSVLGITITLSKHCNFITSSYNQGLSLAFFLQIEAKQKIYKILTYNFSLGALNEVKTIWKLCWN